MSTSPAWSPTGDVIAVVEADGDRPVLAFISPTGERVRPPLLIQSVGVPTAIAWSPDGTRIAFVNLPGRGAAQAWIARLDDGALRMVAEQAAPGDFEGVTWTPDGRSIIVGRFEFDNEVVLIKGLPAAR